MTPPERHGAPALEAACKAKLFAAEAACTAANQTLGGFHRDVRVCQIYEGTSEVQRILIGRALG